MNWAWLTPEVLVFLGRSFWGLLIATLLFLFLRWMYKVSAQERENFKQGANNDMEKSAAETRKVDIIDLIKRANDRFRSGK